MRGAPNKLAWALLLGLAAAVPLAAQTPPPGGSRAKALLDERMDESAKKELIGIDWSVMKAAQQKDRASLEALLAPDFKITRLEDGGALIVGSRDQFLDNRQTIRGYLFVESEARLYGSIGTVASKMVLMSNMSDGSERSGEFLLVDVWQRSGADWKLAARFSSPAEKKAP